MSVLRVLGVVAVVVAGAACGGSVQLGTAEDGGMDGAGGAHSLGDDAGAPVNHPADAGGPVEVAKDAGGPVSHPQDAGGPVSHPADAGGPTDGGKDSGIPMAVPFDAAILDSALPDASDSPIETFEFIVRGAAQQPMQCASTHWEFQGVDGQAEPSVYIRNTGSVPLSYLAQQYWNPGGGSYRPGVGSGVPGALAGTLAPGDIVDITTAYMGGFVAVLGSSKPFAAYDGGPVAGDEGTILWPYGVPDPTDTSTMYVAQIDVQSSCMAVEQLW